MTKAQKEAIEFIERRADWVYIELLYEVFSKRTINSLIDNRYLVVYNDFVNLPGAEESFVKEVPKPLDHLLRQSVGKRLTQGYLMSDGMDGIEG